MEKKLETFSSEFEDGEIIDPFSPCKLPLSPPMEVHFDKQEILIPDQDMPLPKKKSRSRKRKEKPSHAEGIKTPKPRKSRKSRSKKEREELLEVPRSSCPKPNPLDFPKFDSIPGKSPIDERDMLNKLSIMIRDSLGFVLDKLLKGNGSIHNEFKSDELLANLIQKDMCKYSAFMSNRAQMLICSGVDIGKGYTKKKSPF
jgi:hypothetical protein